MATGDASSRDHGRGTSDGTVVVQEVGFRRERAVACLAPIDPIRRIDSRTIVTLGFGSNRKALK
jgi:hypothetical protein